MTLEIVARQRRNIQVGIFVEVGIGVEVGVADEIEGAAVNLIGARFGDDADDPGAVAAVLGSVVTGENAEFSDGVRIRIENDAIVDEVVVEAAIEQIGDGIGASAADVETLAAAGVVGIVFGDSRLQKSETKDVTAIERHVDDGAAGDGLA